MSVDYESKQEVDLGTSETITLTVNLECTCASYPGYFDPNSGGEPPHGPEFDVIGVTVDVPVVKYGRVTDAMAPKDIPWEHVEILYGRELAEELFERACEDACDNGDF